MVSWLAPLGLAIALGGCHVAKHPTTNAPSHPGQSANVTQLRGTRWIVVQLDGSSVLPSTELTLDFMPDHITGFGGFNGFGGQYDPAHPVGFRDVVITAAGCMRAGVEEQENAYYGAVVSTRSARTSQTGLVLADAGGRTRVELKRRPPAPVKSKPLAGTRWRLETMNGAAVPARVYLALEFEDANKFRHVHGCQSATGTYELTGDRLRFPSTAMEYHCDGQEPDPDWRYNYPGDIQQFWNDGSRLHLIGRNHHRVVMRACPDCSMEPRPR